MLIVHENLRLFVAKDNGRGEPWALQV